MSSVRMSTHNVHSKGDARRRSVLELRNCSLPRIFGWYTPATVEGRANQRIRWESLLVRRSMKRILILWVLVSAIAVVTCVAAAGQGATAQISGIVKDQSGAVLPGVEIAATQTETGAVRMTV